MAGFFSAGFAAGFGFLTCGIGLADQTRFSASSKGIAGASSCGFSGVFFMPRPEFVGSYAKLRRAEHFIGELEQDVIQRKESHLRTFHQQLLMTEANGPSPIFDSAQSLHPGVIVGDAIHNLRSALDLMAADLAEANGQNRNLTKFPFSVSADELDKQIKSKRFDLAGADAEKLLHSIAPYHGGNQDLRNLHDLDIQDGYSGRT